jgi:hypothetical protein
VSYGNTKKQDAKFSASLDMPPLSFAVYSAGKKLLSTAMLQLSGIQWV